MSVLDGTPGAPAKGTLLRLPKRFGAPLAKFLGAKRREEETKQESKEVAPELVAAALAAWAEQAKRLRATPETPLYVAADGCDSRCKLTISDRTRSNGLTPVQAGEAKAIGLTIAKRVRWVAHAATFDEQAAGKSAKPGETVADVVARLLARTREISDEQKARLFTMIEEEFLAPGSFAQIATLDDPAAAIDKLNGPFTVALALERK